MIVYPGEAYYMIITKHYDDDFGLVDTEVAFSHELKMAKVIAMGGLEYIIIDDEGKAVEVRGDFDVDNLKSLFGRYVRND